MSDIDCQVCGVETVDIRHISVECFYDLNELSDKFQIIEVKLNGITTRYYYLRACKGCRAVFLGSLRNFIEDGGTLRKAYNIDKEGIATIVVD